MLLTITSTTPPATDLGYLLHKNPARAQSFELPFGQAHVFYPEARDQRCTAALLVEVDPVHLVRGNQAFEQPYVNDRPYVASSLLSVALNTVYRTALSGRCKERPELVGTPLPYEAHLPAVPCRGGVELLGRLFEPLGYTVGAVELPLDGAHPEWGASRYARLTLTGTVTLSALLAHLYVLLPVLDADKHYWIGDDEVDKLLRHGEGWLTAHPDRDLIARRYLKKPRLVREALAQLREEDAPEVDEAESPPVEDRPALNEQRLGAVVAALRGAGARRVLDLGCGEGNLVGRLLADAAFTEIVGLDVSYRAVQVAAQRLHLDRLPEAQRQRVKLLQGALTYRDRRLEGYDAAAVVEVIEHLDPLRLAAFERVLFDCARPQTVVLTTPNVEYNARYERLAEGRLRHRDHRFEWTRAQFQEWAGGVAQRHGYALTVLPVGDEDAELGAPTQMGVFRR